MNICLFQNIFLIFAPSNKTLKDMSKTNTNLHSAKQGKNDEFYTQLSDVEKEGKYYKPLFKDKIVLCNCNDALHTAFATYFSLNFEILGLKELICTSYSSEGHGTIYRYFGDKNENGIPDISEWKQEEMEGNGGFDTPEGIALIEYADIICTNPPFSKFRDFVAILEKYQKQYLIIGNMNAITYKDIFPLIKDNKLWLGPSITSGDRQFNVPNDYPLNAATCGFDNYGKKYIRVKGVRWFTNMEHSHRHEILDLYKKFNEDEYPKFDNYDAININKTCEIPIDYAHIMAVPITFLDKYCPEQFEILDARDYTSIESLKNKTTYLIKDKDGAINGKPTYARILIRKKQ